LNETAFAIAMLPLIDKLDNMAYRAELSGTALITNMLDVLARMLSAYGFNGDVVKAFDTLNRELALDNLTNPLLQKRPYLIFWRNEWAIIDRADWSSGVEPGSVKGPGLFILGFDDRKFYNKAVVKNNFADDGLPLFKSIRDLQSDASDFISYVHNNNMRVHLEGKKAMTYLIFGEDAKNVQENKIEIESNCDALSPRLECLRTRNVRPLGLSFGIREDDGVPICDMSIVVGRLKEAASALRAISDTCLSSTAIHYIF